jgi:hypothetical protein
MKRPITRILSFSYIPPTHVKIFSSSKQQVKTFIYILILYLPFHTGDGRKDPELKCSNFKDKYTLGYFEGNMLHPRVTKAKIVGENKLPK